MLHKCVHLFVQYMQFVIFNWASLLLNVVTLLTTSGQKIILHGFAACEDRNDQRCFKCWLSFNISCKCLAVGSIGFHNTVTMCDCFLSINVRLEAVLCVHISISGFMK